MAEIIVPYALTTRQRIKDRLTITAATQDVLIDRLISAATDLIESMTNRRFKKTTYTNEVYSVYGAKAEFIFLKQLPVVVLTSFQFRAGTPSNPAWTSFLADTYELLQDGASGIIKVYGGLGGIFGGFSGGINQVRATYDAGYLIDFANAGSGTHTLPFDLSDLCERLTIKLYKRREEVGKSASAAGEASVSWKDLLEDEDLRTIAKYRREAPLT